MEGGGAGVEDANDIVRLQQELQEKQEALERLMALRRGLVRKEHAQQQRHSQQHTEHGGWSMGGPAQL